MAVVIVVAMAVLSRRAVVRTVARVVARAVAWAVVGGVLIFD